MIFEVVLIDTVVDDALHIALIIAHAHPGGKSVESNINSFSSK